MIIALVGTPLSKIYRAALESRLDEQPLYLTTREIRGMLPLAALRLLGSGRRRHVVIPFEDPNGRALLPVLQVIAALSPAKTIEVVGPDLVISRVSRLGALWGGLGVVLSTAASWWCVCIARRELERLRKPPRMQSLMAGDGVVTYIKANLSFGLRAGGSVGHVAGVVNGFTRKGLGVEVTSVECPAMLDWRVKYHRVAIPTTFGLPPEVNHYRLNYRFANSLSKEYSNRSVAFVYQRMSTGNWSGVKLSRRLGRPLVLEYNGSEAWIAQHWGTPLRLHGLAVTCEDVNLRHAHVVVTVSEASRDELVARGVEPKRIVVYPNCVDPQAFNPDSYTDTDIRELRAAVGIDPVATVVGFVGTFGRWHGTEVLASVIRELLDDPPEWVVKHRVAFMLVGDGAGMGALVDTLGPHADSPLVRLTGLVPQESAADYLAACDILVSPHVNNEDGTRFFGSPTKLFEYMAMGRPIVASDLEQIGKVLEGSPKAETLDSAQAMRNHESAIGILARPGSRADLKAGIRFLAENPEIRARIGENARSEVLSKYTWTDHVNAIMEALHSDW